MSDFRALTNAEFLNQLVEERYASPLIDEICKRLENLIDQIDNFDERSNVDVNELISGKKMICPICKAKLKFVFNSKFIDIKSTSSLCNHTTSFEL